MGRSLDRRRWLRVAGAGTLLAIGAFGVFMGVPTDDPDTVEAVLYGLLVWAGLLGVVYSLGFAVARVRKGSASNLA